MKDHSEDFADQLGRYLVRVGFTQQELAHKIGMHRNTIVKWMNRTSRPKSRGQVLRVADALSLSKQERKAFLHAAGFSLERWPTEVWTVPQQRDMFFTGRDNVFQSLRELLVPGSTTALTQAISGLGGIGKTHVAIEYAYRFHQDYEAVLWLQADSREVLVSACIKLADELGGNLTLWLKSCGPYDRKSTESSNVPFLLSLHSAPHRLYFFWRSLKECKFASWSWECSRLMYTVREADDHIRSAWH